MLEDVLVLFVADLMEVIHVELSNKGAEVAVPKVDGQDLLLEALDVEDGKVGAVLVPGSDGAVGIILSHGGSTSRISKVLEMKMEGPAIF